MTAGADHREVEPLAGADIAEHHLADMQRQPEADLGLAGRRARDVQGGNGLGGRRGGPQGAGRGRRPFGRGRDGEHRQHSVAHEFQDLAAGRRHGLAGGAEIVVEERDDGVARQAVGGPREAAQVAVPDHRFDGLAVAALDLAGQDAPTGGAADIGIEQVLGGVAQGMDLDDAGEGETAAGTCGRGPPSRSRPANPKRC